MNDRGGALLKRTFDFLIASIGIALLSPLLLCVAVAIYVTMGRPVLFRQQRPGKDSKLFHILKFRTMCEQRDSDGKPLSDEHRLTRLGKLLRSTSIDELPELFNIIRGDMSLVGPRPLLVAYLDRYSDEQRRRHEVRPGLTGWAQVNGRNSITWDERFRLDVWYVDNQSLWLDLKILLMTFWKVACRDGISHPGDATMPEFLGGQPSSGESE